MKLVIIESPYQGGSLEATAANVEYAKRCVKHALARGEAPYASHLFFTQPGILDDLVPEERTLGIEAGFAWGRAADIVAFYIDRGMSKGMFAGYAAANARGANIEFRSLDGEITLSRLIAAGIESADVIRKPRGT